MNNLVYLKNDEPVCSSLQVAEKFGKRHAHVIERIEKIIENDSTENSAQCFKASIYKDSTGKSNKMYVMNRDGFTFLVMGFTGKKANEWKWQYIKAFNQMEKFIREKQTQAWIETRKAGKLTRKAETDTIKNLVEYAKGQGSQHSDKLYMTYSKLANKMAGVSKRDEATVMQLNNLSLMEHIILCVIDAGIVSGKHYKEIYQDCKKRLETVKDLSCISISHSLKWALIKMDIQTFHMQKNLMLWKIILNLSRITLMHFTMVNIRIGMQITEPRPLRISTVWKAHV